MENNEKSKPRYLKLYDELRIEITNGVYGFSEKLPSKRILASDYGCSVTTAEHTLALLCDEGYLRSEERKGYFVSYTEGDCFFDGTRFDVEAVLPLPESEGVRTSDFPPSVYTKAARLVLNKFKDELLIKSPGSGCKELKEAISAYLKRCRGITAKPEQIIIGSGSEYLYGICALLLGNDRKFAIEEPSYHKIREIYQIYKVKFDSLILGKDGIISSELNRTDAQVLHITPYRSFPTGITSTAGKKKEYISWLKAGDRYIIEDDFESELSVTRKSFDTVYSLDETGRTIYLNSFSKSISPALRVSYMILPESLTEMYNNNLGFLSCTVPPFEQYLIAELLTGGSFSTHINRLRRKNSKKL